MITEHVNRPVVLSAGGVNARDAFETVREDDLVRTVRRREHTWRGVAGSLAFARHFPNLFARHSIDGEQKAALRMIVADENLVIEHDR